jgi:tetratricopeptide (TPR) repeat protein
VALARKCRHIPPAELAVIAAASLDPWGRPFLSQFNETSRPPTITLWSTGFHGEHKPSPEGYMTRTLAVVEQYGSMQLQSRRAPMPAGQTPTPAAQPQPAPPLGPAAVFRPLPVAVRSSDPAVEDHYWQEEAKLHQAGLWESERILRERVKGAETAKSDERWETYRLLQFFAAKLAQNNPQRSEAMRGMSDLLYLEGKPAEGKRMFEQALDLLDGRKDKLTAPCETEMRVLTLIKRNDPAAAQEYLDLLLTRYPDSDAAARMKGKLAKEPRAATP